MSYKYSQQYLPCVGLYRALTGAGNGSGLHPNKKAMKCQARCISLLPGRDERLMLVERLIYFMDTDSIGAFTYLVDEDAFVSLL